MKELIQKVLVSFNDVTLLNTVLEINQTTEADYFLLYKLFKGAEVRVTFYEETGTIMLIGNSLKVRKQVVLAHRELLKERELFQEFLKERVRFEEFLKEREA